MVNEAKGLVRFKSYTEVYYNNMHKQVLPEQLQDVVRVQLSITVMLSGETLRLIHTWPSMVIESGQDLETAKEDCVHG